MGYILPSIFYMKLQRDDGKLTTGSLIGHGSIAFLGVVAALASLTITLRSIIQTHTSDS